MWIAVLLYERYVWKIISFFLSLIDNKYISHLSAIMWEKIARVILYNFCRFSLQTCIIVLKIHLQNKMTLCFQGWCYVTPSWRISTRIQSFEMSCYTSTKSLVSALQVYEGYGQTELTTLATFTASLDPYLGETDFILVPW